MIDAGQATVAVRCNICSQIFSFPIFRIIFVFLLISTTHNTTQIVTFSLKILDFPALFQFRITITTSDLLYYHFLLTHPYKQSSSILFDTLLWIGPNILTCSEVGTNIDINAACTSLGRLLRLFPVGPICILTIVVLGSWWKQKVFCVSNWFPGNRKSLKILRLTVYFFQELWLIRAH